MTEPKRRVRMAQEVAEKAEEIARVEGVPHDEALQRAVRARLAGLRAQRERARRQKK